MTTALEHLYEAVEHLRKAREKAGLGTSMMITSIIEDLNELIERTENIEDTDDEG